MPRRSMSLILGSALECLRRLDRRDQGEDSPAIPRRTDIEDAQAGGYGSVGAPRHDTFSGHGYATKWDTHQTGNIRA